MSFGGEGIEVELAEPADRFALAALLNAPPPGRRSA